MARRMRQSGSFSMRRAAAPVASTPISSAYPSTQVSEINAEDDINSIPIASLTLSTPLIPLKPQRRVPAKPFPFLLLPSEIRIKVYEYFFEDAVIGGNVLDLEPDNYKRFHRKLGLMRVCRQIHNEATHLFYSTRTFRIFPTYPGRYFKSKKPLLSRMKPNQRSCITTLELRLGPGWNAPPRGWVVNDALGLEDCANAHKLKVFVECDPSDGFFKGFRRSEGFYEGFSRNLLGQVIETMPAVEIIEFDAWSSVKKSGAMMHGLLNVAAQSGRLIQWGPERGWDGAIEDDSFASDGSSLSEHIEELSVTGYSNVAVSA